MMGRNILEEWELMREESIDYFARKKERIGSEEKKED